MKRSLIAFQALLASSAVVCQTAEASSTYSAPEHLNEAAKANSIEARIEAVRNTDWGSLLKDPEIEDELVAKSKWGNGKGKKFGNSRGKGKWGNGKSGNKWGIAAAPGAMAATTAVGATVVAAGATAAAAS